jgi:signal transduction histidine kinase
MHMVFALGGMVSVAHAQVFPSSQSWKETRQQGKGTIVIHWYESRPFIYANDNGEMGGIEYDLIEGFRKFLHEKKGIDLQVTWKQADSFSGLYDVIRDSQEPGAFGASNFSITTPRREEISFSPPYMSDISVLITSKEQPIVKDMQELTELLPKLTAITIKRTTYEQELLRLRLQQTKGFRIRYIPSSENVLHVISETDSTFGFVDLPVYMLVFSEDPSLNVKRQNLFPIKREGYALIYPRHSDWSEPIHEYFRKSGFQADLEKIVGRYIDLDLYHFVERLAVQSNEREVLLLTKEKEIQYKDLLSKAEQITLETRKRYFLIALVSVTFILLIIIFYLYKKRSEQNKKIEAQGQSIALKSKQLEKRNGHLIALDEEKNNLIKILAHDLRTPVNQIQGLAQLCMLKNTTPADRTIFIQQIQDASVRVNKMIEHLLDVDAIENNRVKIFKDRLLVAPLLRQVIQSFEKQAQKKDIPLRYTSDDDHLVIEGDSLLLLQVFENLISNAIKFSTPGQPVDISLRREDDDVAIHIQDNGPGFTAEDRQLLFRKFQRLSARPTAGESTLGLGLSIVKKYVDVMDGQVICESDVGRGATFILRFLRREKS